MLEGGYHGIFDWVLWGVSMKGWDPASGDPELEPYSAGVPQALREFLHQVPLNDANRLEETFKAHGDKIAALLIEPMMGNCCSLTADKQYIQDVRCLCDRYNVVMIVDEVKTGFRIARGGVQEHLKTLDLVHDPASGRRRRTQKERKAAVHNDGKGHECNP